MSPVPDPNSYALLDAVAAAPQLDAVLTADGGGVLVISSFSQGTVFIGPRN